MIDLVEFSRLLSSAARNLSDREVERIREVEYGFADAIFEMWLRDGHAQSTEENAKNSKI